MLGGLFLALGASEDATAQIAGDTELATFAKMAKRLCFGKPNQVVVGAEAQLDGDSRVQLAEAILTEAKVPVSVLFSAPLPNGTADDRDYPYGKRLIYRMNLIATGKLELKFDPDDSLRIAIGAFHDGLRIADQKALILQGIYNAPNRNPFADGEGAWSLKCPEGDPITGVEELYAKPLERPEIAVRKAPEDLGLSGDAGKEAGAFAFGMERSWSVDDSGTVKRATTIKVDGTIGYQLFGKSSPFSSYAFVRYNLERARTKPATPLAAGATREDDDTNVLQLGATFDFFADPTSSPVPFWVTGDVGYILNFVDESERVRFRAAVDPGLRGNAGICRLGSAKFSANSKFAFRCVVRIETDISHWAKPGRFTTKSYDDHLAVGGDINFSAFYFTGAKSKIIASASGRYLPVLSGKQSDIWRYDLSLAHRHFFDSGAAVEVGFTYQHGFKALTLEKERKLTFGVGVLY